MIALLEYFKRQKHVKIQEKYVLTKILVYLCILRHCEPKLISDEYSHGQLIGTGGTRYT